MSEYFMIDIETPMKSCMKEPAFRRKRIVTDCTKVMATQSLPLKFGEKEGMTIVEESATVSEQILTEGDRIE